MGFFLVFNSPSPIKLFTGNSQRIYDLVGDLQGSVNQWNLLISSGSMVITNISRLKIKDWYAVFLNTLIP